MHAYATGIAILILALLLSGFLGLVQDYTYTKYGRSTAEKTGISWQESMFYLHFLALPLFFLVRSDLAAQLTAINSGNTMSITFPIPVFTDAPMNYDLVIPAAYLTLLVNTLTQLLCVAGVHRLTTHVSALTVTLVLVVRKAVSLILSVAGFGLARGGHGGTVDALMLWSGALMVFIGTVAYSVGSRTTRKKSTKEE